MKVKTTSFYLTDFEHNLVIQALNKFRTKLINDEKHTDFIDEVMLKVISAPQKKVKIK